MNRLAHIAYFTDSLQITLRILHCVAYFTTGQSGARDQVLLLPWKKWLQSFQYYISAKRVVNDAQKKVLLLHTVGIEFQELYETKTDPGRDMFGEDTATEY